MRGGLLDLIAESSTLDSRETMAEERSGIESSGKAIVVQGDAFDLLAKIPGESIGGTGNMDSDTTGNSSTRYQRSGKSATRLQATIGTAETVEFLAWSLTLSGTSPTWQKSWTEQRLA